MQRKIAIYVRMATDEQLNGAQSQTDELLKFIDQKLNENSSWGTLVETYVDKGMSGMTMDRPALNRMLEDIRHEKVNTVLIKDVARLSRNSDHFLSILEELHTHKASLYDLNGLTDMSVLERTKSLMQMTRINSEKRRVQKNTDQIKTDSGTISSTSRA